MSEGRRRVHDQKPIENLDADPSGTSSSTARWARANKALSTRDIAAMRRPAAARHRRRRARGAVPARFDHRREHPIDCGHGVGLGVRPKVAVDVECLNRGPVPQPVLRDLDALALGDQQRGSSTRRRTRRTVTPSRWASCWQVMSGGWLVMGRSVAVWVGGHPPLSTAGAPEIGAKHTIDVGKMNGEHFAVMGGIGPDAADDQRRRRRPERPLRLGRLRLDRKPDTFVADRCGPRCGSTATTGSTARRAVCSSSTWDRSVVASPPSSTPLRTTASWTLLS